ncbi:hypothetical protein [Phytomonospora endophytica]|uniref:Uncharacterized protein n=1 Tax=Phytomonospora endophytica TaxID=714109 RepID=A0A841FIK9_9ACTN|nr:hypothetical protein [Phytomonospora endophytica]MBB6032977.1 hypothetical protein [Phytomonospora endophytica]GIG65203.1 hypothetical protein Pen01_14980 [Phytomonospora endophytica]
MSHEVPAEIAAIIEEQRGRTFDAVSAGELCRVTVDIAGRLTGVVFLRNDVFAAGTREEVAAELRDAIRAARAEAVDTLTAVIAAAQE